MFASFFQSARHLRQTVAQINAPDAKRQSQAAVVKHGDFPAIERVLTAFLALETEAVRIVNDDNAGGSNTVAEKRGMALLTQTAAHDRFLMVTKRELLRLKSKSHKQLRDHLAEYLNHAESRNPQLLAEIGRALSTALLIV